MSKWLRTGAPYIWLTAGSVAISLIMVFGLLALIAWRGLGHFWPNSVEQITYKEGSQHATLLGEMRGRERISVAAAEASGSSIITDADEVVHYHFRVGSRGVGEVESRVLPESLVVERRTPDAVIVVERRGYGTVYGYLKSIRENGRAAAINPAAWGQLQQRVKRAVTLLKKIRSVENKQLAGINSGLERLRLHHRRLELAGGEPNATELASIEKKRTELTRRHQQLLLILGDLNRQLRRDNAVVELGDGTVTEIPIAELVRVYRPNTMGVFGKVRLYLLRLWEFISSGPHSGNTEGGILPAIFGTVMMVILMSVFVTPLGVIAAVYLHEYARQGVVVRMVRIAVSNLAGVPSIVYGVFGLGLFVYVMGGSIDRLFFAEALPAPTFGTPGILWASLTLALLTLPVVIVSTEEGLARVPNSFREGSFALGATKFETLRRTILPMASPAIMTGLILAVARAAGEVAPLMLVGVVKLAPTLPVDSSVPFIHLERKFMHLGFHIYDLGFRSPNLETARPFAYTTALLLMVVVVVLNLTAVRIRSHLRRKYRALEI